MLIHYICLKLTRTIFKLAIQHRNLIISLKVCPMLRSYLHHCVYPRMRMVFLVIAYIRLSVNNKRTMLVTYLLYVAIIIFEGCKFHELCCKLVKHKFLSTNISPSMYPQKYYVCILSKIFALNQSFVVMHTTLISIQSMQKKAHGWWKREGMEARTPKILLSLHRNVIFLHTNAS